MVTQDYQKISSDILGILPLKQKEIISRRFGLEGGRRETLDGIGQSFGVTRERVRQIEEIAFRSLQEEAKLARRKELEKAFSCFKQYLGKQGGLKREDLLLSELGGERLQNHIYFLLTLGEPFQRFREDNNFYTFWVIDESLFEKTEEILKALLKIFAKEKKPLSEEEFFNTFENEPSNLFNSSFEIFKRIEKGPLGDFGLIDWPQIKPAGVKDRAFLVFKKYNRPLHFKEIADLAGELEGTACKKKKLYSSTVHNELIKSDVFVLIGKGIYALRNWGYKPGTVKDIIIDILKIAKQPLTKEEIIEEVLKQRQVQKNTIFLNLQDENLIGAGEGKYYLIKKI
jgi:hypothetical protein